MTIEVIDNFLNDDDFRDLSNLILGNNFPWFYGNVVEDDAEEINEKYNFQFTHVFYNFYEPNSQYYKNLKKLISKLNASALLRIKANLSTRTDKIVEFGYHTDFSNVSSCVYYLNTNNGYTKFKNGKIVNSVANRALIFNSNLMHTGTSCSDSDKRIAININFVPETEI